MVLGGAVVWSVQLLLLSSMFMPVSVLVAQTEGPCGTTVPAGIQLSWMGVGGRDDYWRFRLV